MPSAAVFVNSSTSLASSAKPAERPDNQNGSGRKSGDFTPILALTAGAAVLCSAIPAGYNIGVLNTPRSIIESFCNETIYNTYGLVLSTTQVNLVWSVVVAIYLIGGMIGSFAAGWLCNTFGRKGAIQVVNVLGLVSALLLSLCRVASSVEMLILGRLVVGVFSGFSTSAVPMYLTEIAPARIRGSLGVLLPLGMTSGILISLFLSLDSVLGTEWGWPYLLGLYAFVIGAGSMALVFCPESPKYLYIIKGRSEDAIKQLCRLRGNARPDQVEPDVQEMKSELRHNLNYPPWTIKSVLTSPDIRLPMLLLFALHGGQQLAGINAVFYYSTSIFKSAGMDAVQSQYASIGAGLINFLMSAISTWLVSRFGRRPLLLTSDGLVVVCLVGLTGSFIFMDAAPFVPHLSVAFLLLYVLVFGLGLGPIPFFLGSEILPAGPRPAAMSMGCTVNWLCNFLVGLTFPSLQACIGFYSFLIFAGIASALWLVIFFKLPESKGKSVDEMTDKLNPSNGTYGNYAINEQRDMAAATSLQLINNNV